jgi:hypothetical protein
MALTSLMSMIKALNQDEVAARRPSGLTRLLHLNTWKAEFEQRLHDLQRMEGH